MDSSTIFDIDDASAIIGTTCTQQAKLLQRDVENHTNILSRRTWRSSILHMDQRLIGSVYDGSADVLKDAGIELWTNHKSALAVSCKLQVNSLMPGLPYACSASPRS